MEEKVFNAALAGLLHDVGKFALRAGEGASRTWDEEAKKDFKYLHALLTADFIDQYVPDPWRVPVKNAAGNHHRPARREEHIISVADHLSAGERADVSIDQRIVQPRQLLSIFCSVEAEHKLAKDAWWPLKPLALPENAGDKSLFPAESWEETQVWKAYEALWQAFCQEARQLKIAHASTGHHETYLESILLMLQRYSWCMPSAYYHSRPDISLYDHNRMTAALAGVLADSSLQEEDLKRLETSAAEDPSEIALLVGGDISGVQDFIYTITSRGATSALRGRSFYLQLPTEAVARFVLRRLELPITNVVYAGGGNFYLLARPTDRPRLQEIQRQVSQVLLYHHRGDLYLALASLPLKSKDFFGGTISQAWGQLVDSLQKSKQRRFGELGPELKVVFRPQGHGGNEDRQCQVCGNEHPATGVDRLSRDPDTGEGVRKCPQCSSYEELGKDLRQAEYLILEEVELPEPPGLEKEPEPGTWRDVLHSLGLRAHLVEGKESIKTNNGDNRVILALSEPALQNLAELRDAHTATGRRFLVNVTPVITNKDATKYAKEVDEELKPGDIKPFSLLEQQSRGIKRLGVLHMDIDNLGRLFSEGLGERASLSRVAALSFTINLYFEGWVGTLAEQHGQAGGQNNTERRLYSIYSGGDDLFFVGSWDALVELARQIRADLTDFAAGHAGIHASTGIALVGGKYPLYQAAEDAHRALGQAKMAQWYEGQNAKTKDAITFLGQPLPWTRFGLEPCDETGIFTAHALMHLIVDEMERSAANPLIRRLIGLHLRYLEALERRRKRGGDQNRAGQEQTLWGPWNWLGYYSLSRLSGQRQEKSIRDLRDQLKADNFRSIEWMGLAARWAELILRGER